MPGSNSHGAVIFHRMVRKGLSMTANYEESLEERRKKPCALPKCLFQESRGCKDPGVGRCSERGTEKGLPQWMSGGRREEM